VQIRAEQLPAQLARSLAPLYTLHGDEPLLALEAADAVRAASRRAGCEERELLVAERSFDWASLMHAAASRSLFGGRKLIELRIPSGRPGSAGAAAIVRYCDKLAPENVTLVSLPRLRRDEQGAEWFRALAGAGVVVDIYPVDRSRLADWIAARLAHQRQRAPREVLEFLAERVEGNLLAAHQEVQKLALLAPEGELALEQVERAVANVARYDMGDCAAALAAGDLARYARVLEGLRGEGEPANLVLWALAEELRAIVRVQQGLAAGRPMEQLLRENRVWGPRQATMRAAVACHGRAALERALTRAARIDRVVKGVAHGDPWDELLALGLEFLHGTEGARKIA
jgi:DNA polymerase-3 subunit delta